MWTRINYTKKGLFGRVKRDYTELPGDKTEALIAFRKKHPQAHITSTKQLSDKFKLIVTYWNAGKQHEERVQGDTFDEALRQITFPEARIDNIEHEHDSRT